MKRSTPKDRFNKKLPISGAWKEQQDKWQSKYSPTEVDCCWTRTRTSSHVKNQNLGQFLCGQNKEIIFYFFCKEWIFMRNPLKSAQGEKIIFWKFSQDSFPYNRNICTSYNIQDELRWKHMRLCECIFQWNQA